MNTITIDFSALKGKIKPMHAVNNGPAGSRVRGGNSTFKYFEEAGIPYVRNHDASFYSGYGGEHTVDVHRIFRNFDADVNDPASYSFDVTDRYLQDIESVGSKTFYRLGSRIEHGKKEGTYPPKDFQKWAEICEHIIRHYREGWADGFNMDIEYWEIWNEPECQNADGSNPCWQGTMEQFSEFFVTAFRHLKKCFPDLKIGGPAFMSAWNKEYNKSLFTALNKENLQLDFYSFHGYANEPSRYYNDIEEASNTLKMYGAKEDTELILNEWNYVRGWLNDDWVYTLHAEKGLKGSSFIAGTMCVGQNSALDMLMYYDARPCTMNGMFDTDFLTPLKGYYPFKMYNELYKLGSECSSSTDDKLIYTCAAKSEDKAAIMFTYFSEDDTKEAKQIKLQMKNFGVDDGVKASYYLLDEAHDLELVKEEVYCGKEFSSFVELPLFTSYLVILEKI